MQRLLTCLLTLRDIHERNVVNAVLYKKFNKRLFTVRYYSQMLPMTVYSLTGRACSLTTLTAENAFNTDSIFKKKKRLCYNCL